MAKKVFTYRGKTLEALQEMSDKAFIKLLPSTQRRKFHKGHTPAEKIFLQQVEKGRDNIKTHCRGIVILPKMVGKTFQVYNGHSFETVIIKEEMIGHRLGEFSQTRSSISHSAPGVGATRSSSAVSVK